MTLCRNPYMQGMHAHGCGQCMPCRINRARTWTHRILLEANEHKDNSFLTLTYHEQNLTKRAGPSGQLRATLLPTDLQNWLKRLRMRIAPLRIRFYACGEYGDETERPHYHVALFGFPSCSYIQSRYSKFRRDCCSSCDLVRDTWSLGHVFLGSLEAASAGYVAGYITKKMTRHDDPRLDGRHPEFCRMSLRPGIGAFFMDEVASSLMQFNLEEATQGDVPSTLRHGTREMPLGRYLRRRLRTRIGKEANAPTNNIDPQMLALQLAARGDEKIPSLKAHLVASTTTRALSLQSRFKIYKPKGSV